MKRFGILSLGVILGGMSLIVSGCAKGHVKRVKVEETIDFSGRWNDSDSRMVSETMIQECLEGPWLARFQGEFKRDPVIIVGAIKNKSHEHINADVFIKDLERHLINAGKVKFVASRDERGDLRTERIAQNDEGFTNPATIKKIGMETGADYMLIGSVNSVKDELKDRYLILYQVNLELINLETNEKVWIGQEPIKKVVKRSKYSL
jgi:uncharacterized protein (TIGR02722 family)